MWHGRSHAWRENSTSHERKQRQGSASEPKQSRGIVLIGAGSDGVAYLLSSSVDMVLTVKKRTLEIVSYSNPLPEETVSRSGDASPSTVSVISTPSTALRTGSGRNPCLDRRERSFLDPSHSR